MKKRVLELYNEGSGCAQCILQAAGEFYHLPVDELQLKAFSAVNGGFGIGGFCAVLVAVLMVFGMLFSEDKAKKLRMVFLCAFQEKYGCLNCGVLSGGDCKEILMDATEWMETLIAEELEK